MSIREFSAPRYALDHAPYFNDVKYYNADLTPATSLDKNHEDDQKLLTFTKSFEPLQLDCPNTPLSYIRSNESKTQIWVKSCSSAP